MKPVHKTGERRLQIHQLYFREPGKDIFQGSSGKEGKVSENLDVEK